MMKELNRSRRVISEKIVRENYQENTQQKYYIDGTIRGLTGNIKKIKEIKESRIVEEILKMRILKREVLS